MRYTDSHEWVTLQGKLAKVGISEYAQQELGDIVFIELPKVGQVVAAGEEVCVLESTKAAADVYAPVSGKVHAVNEVAKKDPSEINRNAEALWLFEIELSNPKEFDRLLTPAEYRKITS
jgi:glycine cleavage system H protein